jgi:hypothetical protein
MAGGWRKVYGMGYGDSRERVAKRCFAIVYRCMYKVKGAACLEAARNRST